jgi:hypothetical protein
MLLAMALPPQSVRDQLAQAPIREVLGIVDSRGARIGRPGNQELYNVNINFEQWKLPGGEMRALPLALFQQRPLAEALAIRSSVKDFEVFRVRAHVVETETTNPIDPIDAWLVEIIGEDNSDPELNRLARAFREPVSYRDDQLGTFLLDRKLNRFEGEALWNARPVRLILNVGKDQNPGPALEIAHQLWASSALWNERALDAAVRNLLSLRNERWRQDNGPEITGESFRSRIRLQSIVVTKDGQFEFWFEDDDLFRGHAIRVCGNLTEGLISAGLEG